MLLTLLQIVNLLFSEHARSIGFIVSMKIFKHLCIVPFKHFLLPCVCICLLVHSMNNLAVFLFTCSFVSEEKL